MQNVALACACACLVLAASVVRRAAATCDPAIVDKIKQMHPDNNEFANVIDQLPGEYLITSISIVDGSKHPRKKRKKHCLKFNIAKEDGKTVIKFAGVEILAYPLIFIDGKLEYSGENRAVSVAIEDITISYYIVHHTPKAVSFYTCSNQTRDSTLSFVAIPVAHATGDFEEQDAIQATLKLKEVGVTELDAVALCSETHKTTSKHTHAGDQQSGLSGKLPEEGKESKKPRVKPQSLGPPKPKSPKPKSPKPKSPKKTEQDNDAKGN